MSLDICDVWLPICVLSQLSRREWVWSPALSPQLSCLWSSAVCWCYSLFSTGETRRIMKKMKFLMRSGDSLSYKNITTSPLFAYILFSDLHWFKWMFLYFIPHNPQGGRSSAEEIFIGQGFPRWCLVFRERHSDLHQHLQQPLLAQPQTKLRHQLLHTLQRWHASDLHGRSQHDGGCPLMPNLF